MRLRVKNIKDESGLVSIVVTMVIMSIVTLIALGFSQLASREQRQALDQQLSTQAFYAAESGINDAIINSTSVDDCDNDPEELGGDQSVAVTCLIIEDEPESLDFNVGTDRSTVVPIEPSAPMTELSISWKDPNNLNGFAGNCNNELLNSTDWTNANRPGMLRAMLIPRNFASRDALIDGTSNLLLYPSSATASCADTVAHRTASTTLGGRCDTARNPHCTVKITFSPVNSGPFVLRLKSIYSSTSVVITGRNATGPVRFLNAQKQIDSTGRTTDVLRRLRVSVPHENNRLTDRLFPEFSVETGESLCKRMLVGAGFPATIEGDNDPACNLVPTP